MTTKKEVDEMLVVIGIAAAGMSFTAGVTSLFVVWDITGGLHNIDAVTGVFYILASLVLLVFTYIKHIYNQTVDE